MYFLSASYTFKVERKFLLKTPRYFSFFFSALFLLFFISTKSVLADCSYSCGFLGWSTCYTPVGGYRCSGSVLQRCSSSNTFTTINDCYNSAISSSYSGTCVDSGDNDYCTCGYAKTSTSGGGAYPAIMSPVGISGSYSSSSLIASGNSNVCVTNGDFHNDDASDPCRNNNGSKTRSIDCQYLDHQSGNCVWSSSEGQCVPKAPSCTCNASLAPLYCTGTTYPNSCGNYSSPTCYGTKPSVDGGWTAWGTCDANVGVCGGGIQYRSCSNPYPSCGGDYCVGASSQSCTVSCPSGQNCINNYCQTPLNGSCTSPLNLNRCHSGIIGTGDGSQNCVDRYGVCQTNGGSIPPSGGSCTLNNGVAGTYVSGLCGGIYDTNYRCCVPNSGADPAGNSKWMCRGDFGGTNTTCSCPAEVSCTSTCHTNTLYVSNGDCGTKACPPNAPAAGTCPVCRTTASTVPNGSCGTTSCPVNCSTTCVGNVCNSPPVLGSLTIKNNVPAVVPVQTGNRNQICQSAFNGSRTVTFEIPVSDADGLSDISNITLTWNGKTIPRIGAIGAITTFGGTLDNSFNYSGIYPLIITVTDSAGQKDTEQSRLLKIWDCNVSITGTGYDGSASSANCAPASFSQQITLPYTLSMVGVATPTVKMTVSSPGYSGNLVWGKSYQFSSNIPGSYFNFRFNDSITCDNDLLIDIDEVKVDPYNNPVQLDIDFTSILDQDPWWQSIDGGVISNTSINNQVPVTCVSNCKISTNALVAAPSIDNTGRTPLTDIQTWYWQSANAKLANVNENYIYFKDQYYNKNQIGTLSTGTKTVTTTDNFGTDPNNIYFIDGDLNINGNLTLGTRKFLMIIVSGNITISKSVTQVDGIFVAKNIYATGDNATRLTINGSLYASDSVEFTRGFTTGSANNTAAAVVIDHNPSLLFNIPGKLAKVLTSWQWGN